MPLPDPTHPLSHVEKLVFGHDGKRHPITGYPLERGYGALSPDEQAKLHCEAIEQEYGKEAADAMRRKLVAANSRDNKTPLMIVRPTMAVVTPPQV